MALVFEVGQVKKLLAMGRRKEPVHGKEIHLVLGQREAVAGQALALFFGFKVEPAFATCVGLRNATPVDEKVERNL